MSNVQVLLPSGNLKPLGASPVCEMEARASSSSLSDHARTSKFKQNFGFDSESDSTHQPCKKFKKAPRRRRKKKKAHSGVVRVCKPYAPFNSNQFLMEEYDPLHFSDSRIFPHTSSRALDPEGARALPSRASAASGPPEPTQLPTSSEDPPACSAEASAVPENLGCEDLCPVLLIDESSASVPATVMSERGDAVQWTEFCMEQFMGDYRDLSEVRLDNMTKTELVEEYLSLEEQLSQLQRKLKEISEVDRDRKMIIERECDVLDLQPGELLVNHEAAEKISVFKSEIHALQLENEMLLQRNAELRALRRQPSSGSSSCSSSSSSSSSSGWSSSDDSSSSDSECEDKREDGDAVDEGVCPADDVPSRVEGTDDASAVLTAGKDEEDVSESAVEQPQQLDEEATEDFDPSEKRLHIDAGDFMDSGVDNNEVHSEDEIKDCETIRD
ncbi:uncharacterized protein LOC108681164 [Hyalella azteca]|uniref:Uncharacterized protein LOC108681164 n=1 Tax=Hyalella azteca TaxID=294128 RepID=A0A8B7PHM0_HYAAZ|nr:uncharacterized protein LOC108681164 [Hyalella azteca]